MAVDYSGLQQSQTMLEQAKLQEAGAASKGLEEGLKPLQKQLESIAEKKEKREAQLKLDQGKAIEYMQEMADTSGLLGQYEPIITELAKDVKFELNAIAQDESLNSFEKSAKYKEVVQRFNKKASRFAREQELTTAFNEAFATGKLSGAINTNSDNYKIAAALSNGHYKVNKDGTYTILGEDKKTPLDLENSFVDSKRLKEIYLPLKTVDANEVSKTIGDIGANAKNTNQVEVGLRDLATEIGTIDAGKELLVDGLNMDIDDLNSELKGIEENKQLEWLRNKIVEKGKGIANYVFLEKQPPVVAAGPAKVMATDYYNRISRAYTSGDWSGLINMEYQQGKITDAKVENGRLVLSFLDKSGNTYTTKDLMEGGGYNLNSREMIQGLAEELIEDGGGSPTQIYDTKYEFTRLWNAPATDDGDDGDDGEISDNKVKILDPEQQVTNWATIVSDKEDRKTISQTLRDNIDDDIINSVRNKNNPSRQLTKMDTEIVASNGKVDDEIVTTQEFKDLYPNYPYAAYGQDDASLLAKVPRRVKRSIINKLNIKNNTEIADIYNNKISLERYNQLKKLIYKTFT